MWCLFCLPKDQVEWTGWLIKENICCFHVKYSRFITLFICKFQITFLKMRNNETYMLNDVICIQLEYHLYAQVISSTRCFYFLFMLKKYILYIKELFKLYNERIFRYNFRHMNQRYKKLLNFLWIFRNKYIFMLIDRHIDIMLNNLIIVNSSEYSAQCNPCILNNIVPLNNNQVYVNY